ncbi:MAG: DUF5723 family protein [Bacteroidetes bacterium]|nr:DUF5723 family protein [Bacteroidota bacterium]
MFILLQPSHAQEALGIVNSNYTGVNSLWINPANAANSRNTVSINILAGDLFVNSNYVFVHRKDYGLLKIFRVNIDDPKYMYIYSYPEFNFTDTVQYYDYYKNSTPKRLYLNERIAGPSLLYKSGDHAFSFTTAFRSNVSGTNIPCDVANFGFRGLDFIPQQDITYSDGHFEIAMLSWIELGAGYTYTFYNDGRNSLSAGISLKYLLGTAAAYATFKNITYRIPYQDTLIVYDMNATIGIALPMDYSTNKFSLSPLVRGKGIGGDIGITYERLTGRPANSSLFSGSNSGEENDYQFRAGISILDVGRINFTTSAEVHKFNNVTNRIWPGLIGFKGKSIGQFLRSASYNLLGDSAASLSDQSNFYMWLPSALSAQFDYNFGNQVYLNATFVQGITFGSPGIRRETLLALTPRYETRIWEVNLPLSIVDFKHPAIGLAVRIYSLVIGTEKLGTLVNLTNVRGLDLYFSLGINLNPKTGERHSKSKGCESIREYKRYQVH